MLMTAFIKQPATRWLLFWPVNVHCCSQDTSVCSPLVTCPGLCGLGTSVYFIFKHVISLCVQEELVFGKKQINFITFKLRFYHYIYQAALINNVISLNVDFSIPFNIFFNTLVSEPFFDTISESFVPGPISHFRLGYTIL